MKPKPLISSLDYENLNSLLHFNLLYDDTPKIIAVDQLENTK